MLAGINAAGRNKQMSINTTKTTVLVWGTETPTTTPLGRQNNGTTMGQGI